MSGLEIVGVALGAFPLIIAAIESYGKAWKKVSALRKHGQEVANFNLDLDTEATIFRNTCENLLEPHLSPGTIDRLTASAATNEELRRDLDNLNEVLNVKLRPNALKSFLANMEEMKKLLDELAKTYPVEDLEALATISTKDSAKAYVKKIRSTVKFHTLTVMHEDNLSRARRINQSLRTLAKDGSYPEEVVTHHRRIAKAIKFYQSVHVYAIRLYEVMREKLSRPGCPCIRPHDAALQLDIRDFESIAKSSNGYGEFKTQVRFRAFMSLVVSDTGITWQGMEVEPVEENADDLEDGPENAVVEAPITNTKVVAACESLSSLTVQASGPPKRSRSPFKLAKSVRWGNTPVDIEPVASITVIGPTPTPLPALPLHVGATQPTFPRRHSTPNPVEIKILCAHLSKIYETEDQPISAPSHAYLVCTSTRLRICPIQERKALRPSTACGRSPQSIVTLYELFDRGKSFARKFSFKHQLQLAACLASSVLQLYSSGWMEEEWGGDDIVFLEGPEGKLQLDTPLTIGQLQRKKTDESRTADSEMPIQTPKTLLSLGIVLSEIHFKESYTDWLGPEWVARYSSFSTTDQRFIATKRLCDGLKDQVSDGYYSAVERCFFGISGIKEKTIDNKAYYEAVYTGIVCPLKETLAMAFPAATN